MDPLPSRDLDMEGQPGTANQFGDGNRMFANLGGSQKNIEGSSYESGGGVMNIVNNINRVSAEETAPSSQVSRVIPLPRNEDMVDRTHIFARLDALLPPKSDYQSAALSGLGGSGKTQVALQYAYNRCRDPACSVFWVHADNETTFAQDYKSIAKRLGLAKLDGEKLLTAVRERIESGPPWLLVLDNADDLALFGVGLASHNTSSGRPEELTSLYNYVPSSGTGTVLWTSRDERIVGTLVGSRRGIQVGPMSPAEAKILLGTSRNEEVASKDAVDAEKLLQELQWLPLAISQAGAYLRRTSTPITDYLSKLAEERWQTLKETEFDRHRRPNVPNSVLETWNISIERIQRENKMAYRIMHIIAYVNNQDIPFEIITAAGLFGDEGGVGDPRQNKDRVVKAVTRLKEFSFLGFLRGVDNTRSYEMHKLVQEATRYGLSIRNPEKEVYFSGIALQIMAELFPERKREAWAECERYIAHAVQVDYLYDRGRWREKEPVDQRAYDLRRAVLGEKHPDTIRSMADLATTYNAQGRYAEAEPMNINILELRREVLGEKHPDTIWNQNTRAAAGSARRETPDTIGSMADLAATYRMQGRYTEAEPMKIKALELRREVLGEKHPDTIWSIASLAATYHAQGRYTEAEPMKIKVLELWREVLGEKHPDSLQTMHDLVITWNSRGRRDDAIGLMNNCLRLRQTVLGPEHPFTKQSAQTLNRWKNG
ncbi:P-loop containing nucleoside triphosphate hydrolase protein [Rhypophila decipiens]|uniref:P-loop containing nucleoside triphosphate hydrolase protein n=1 Tax=Rhypophila decipiens TaxID=261697 RepID=A0AAN6XTZ9_9PEZI|nr:P-loop containing nucleoside triphosphate hydrolase protein [Rhypophila decipiens]